MAGLVRRYRWWLVATAGVLACAVGTQAQWRPAPATAAMYTGFRNDMTMDRVLAVLRPFCEQQPGARVFIGGQTKQGGTFTLRWQGPGLPEQGALPPPAEMYVARMRVLTEGDGLVDVEIRSGFVVGKAWDRPKPRWAMTSALALALLGAVLAAGAPDLARIVAKYIPFEPEPDTVPKGELERLLRMRPGGRWLRRSWRVRERAVRARTPAPAPPPAEVVAPPGAALDRLVQSKRAWHRPARNEQPPV